MNGTSRRIVHVLYAKARYHYYYYHYQLPVRVSPRTEPAHGSWGICTNKDPNSSRNNVGFEYGVDHGWGTSAKDQGSTTQHQIQQSVELIYTYGETNSRTQCKMVLGSHTAVDRRPPSQYVQQHHVHSTEYPNGYHLMV